MRGVDNSTEEVVFEANRVLSSSEMSKGDDAEREGLERPDQCLYGREPYVPSKEENVFRVIQAYEDGLWEDVSWSGRLKKTVVYLFRCLIALFYPMIQYVLVLLGSALAQLSFQMRGFGAEEAFNYGLGVGTTLILSLQFLDVIRGCCRERFTVGSLNRGAILITDRRLGCWSLTEFLVYCLAVFILAGVAVELQIDCVNTDLICHNVNRIVRGDS